MEESENLYKLYGYGLWIRENPTPRIAKNKVPETFEGRRPLSISFHETRHGMTGCFRATNSIHQLQSGETRPNRTPNPPELFDE